MADLDIRDGTVQEATSLTANDRSPIFRIAAGKWYIDPAFYVDRGNHTGSQLAATISDLTAAINGNTEVAANASARHTHANKAILDLISDVGSRAIITVTERALINFITLTQAINLDNIANSVKKQSLSGSTPILNCDSGYNADFPMTANAVINLTNAPAGAVSGGEVILRNTNSYTLTMQLAGSSTNVAKMVGAEDLPAGATDTAILTWIYDGTYLTYNIGKRTEA